MTVQNAGLRPRILKNQEGLFMTAIKSILLKIFRTPLGHSFFTFYLSLFLAIAIADVSSAEAFDFSIIGAASSSSYSITPPPDVLAGGAGFGLGVTLGFDLIPFFSLESGALYIVHSLSASVGNLTARINYNYLQIPALLRFTPVPFITLEAGGYYGIPISTSSTGVIPSSLVSSTSSTYSSSNDFGFLVGAGLRFPLLPVMSIRLDALYEYGLTNVSTGTATQYSRNLDIWAGVTLSLI
ncbi:MAG: outer membrane beta-barrel protein [Bdellovibrionia bacterium]